MRPSPETVEDGCGNVWYRCHYSDCDLSVVRPGKVQCSGCDVDSLRAERSMAREAIEQIHEAAKGTALEGFVSARYEYCYGKGGNNPFMGWKVECLERENARLEALVEVLEKEKGNHDLILGQRDELMEALKRAAENMKRAAEFHGCSNCREGEKLARAAIRKARGEGKA